MTIVEQAVDTNGKTRTQALRVLVAIDGSCQSVRACEALTKVLPSGARIRLLTVVSFGMYPFALTGDHLSDEAERIRSVRMTVISRQAAARAILERAGFETDEVFRYGFPPDEILAEVEEAGADLVVLGHRALSAATRWIASVSDRVTNRAGVPVLLVP